MIYHGDLFDVLPAIADESIDACVTDGPYGIGFMNRKWDTFAPEAAELRITENDEIESDNPNLCGRKRGPASSPSAVEYDRSLAGQIAFQEFCAKWGREVFRVLKPGAYLLSCGAPRSYHRMACGLEDAGFVIRDKFSWLFGSGFPKSLNLGDGKGTALKPAHEPIALAWKPFKGTIQACHQAHGTAALNIDACRLGSDTSDYARTDHGKSAADGLVYGFAEYEALHKRGGGHDLGRWPANVLLDEEAAALLDEMSGLVGGWSATERHGKAIGVFGAFAGGGVKQAHDGIGGASRFYYVAKPSREERDLGCHDLTPRQRDESRRAGNPGGDNPRNRGLQLRGNIHPTVKPVELMRWLVRLVTPPGGTVLDPFAGSFTTALACILEHRPFVMIEREAEYVEIGKARIRAIAPLFVNADEMMQPRQHGGDVPRTPVDVPGDAPSESSTPDCQESRSGCPDPCDAPRDLTEVGHE